MGKKVRRVREEILGVVSLLGSIYLSLSLFSYSRWDPSLFTFTTAAPRNYGGIVGAYIADFIISVLGVSSFFIPVLLVAFGVRRLIGKEGHKSYLLGSILFVFSSSLLASLLLSTFHFPAKGDPGGIVGLYISSIFRKYLSLPGAYIVSLSGFLSSIILLSPISVTSLTLGRKSAKIPQRKKEPEKGIVEEDIILQEPEFIQEVVPVLTEREPVTTEEPIVSTAATPSRKSTANGYHIPHLDLLTTYDASSVRASDDEIRSNSALLENRLREFDVEGRITRVHPGPVVTLYEFEPAPGVKINRVVSLADDLALGLKAQSMRVLPIPGKSTIGIEVPNKLREVVSLREIVSSDSFRKSQSRLTLALGKDIFGKPVIADLTKMPHLLVAGATGAGKSVSINSMVMSILYKATPHDVKMLMIDPKLLELSMYEDIPHLISGVITNPKDASEALRKMVFEMERRYRLLAEKGARNIESFNSQVSREDQIPYIVIFIDELADLMFASANEVEDSIARLAQMARAAGIHLIIATQRPSVDVITGVIKANFPARISFQVFSKIDSRTILDSQGAEQLLGKGDMLLMLPGSRIMRVHGALVTENEITAVTKFIKSQGAPDYSIFENIKSEDISPPDPSEERDDMYYKAFEFAESVGEISISSLQRRFKIGYNRAARLMDMFEEDGLVGPQKGAGKPRDFLRRHR